MFLVPVIPAVAIWFKKSLGLATGIIIGMWSLGPAIVIHLMGIMLDSIGWQNTFIISGLVGSLIMVIALSFFKNTPQDKGILPYGAKNNDKEEEMKHDQPTNNHYSNLQKIVYENISNFEYTFNNIFW